MPDRLSSLRSLASGLVLLALAAPPAPAGEAVFEARVHRGPLGIEIPYRLHVPREARRSDPRKFPLILALHGLGDRGRDNRSQLLGSPIATAWADDSLQARHPAFVVAPQCPPGETWINRDIPVAAAPLRPTGAALLELLDSLAARHPMDTRRIYLVGLSMGGHAAWELPMRHPERFAATVPICGRGDTAGAVRLVDIPVWAFHGAEDAVVPASASRNMIAALRRAGGKPRYTEFPGIGHDAWTPALRDPGLAPWLFAQARPAK